MKVYVLEKCLMGYPSQEVLPYLVFYNTIEIKNIKPLAYIINRAQLNVQYFLPYLQTITISTVKTLVLLKMSLKFLMLAVF